ncbi:unnamed protein product [Colias eurytheme]|nr:unnamed protein product [Colias eurytheme]
MTTETLQDYSNDVQRLKKECIDAGISEDEFRRMYLESLRNLENSNQYKRKLWLKIFIIVFAISCMCVRTTHYREIYSFIICNLQEYIYPGLRFWRQISIPFLSIFPVLTGLHQETCLIQNPYFTVVDMDCWPCSNVQNVREIQNPNPSHRQHISPLIYLTKQPELSWTQLSELYVRNRKIFDAESPKVLVNNKYYLSPADVFSKNHNSNTDNNLYIWKINTLNAARTLRQYIPRPKIVPKFGQSSERYIIVDTKGYPFKVPDTECNFSFLLVLSGKRTVTLAPADECKHQCRSLEIKLPESYLLWYNWWYWRPTVQQTLHNETFIAHVGSYC